MKHKSAAADAFERALLEQANPMLEAWKPFLDAPNTPALESTMDRYIVATMLQNSKPELQRLAEAGQTTAIFGTAYVPTMLGMIRQIFPRLVGREIVSIQPVDRPSGKVFKLETLRDDNSDPTKYASWGTYSSYADHTTGELTAITKGMRLRITSSDIAIGEPKKLLTEASLELLQDLRAYHNLDASDLLQGAAVDELAREIDGVLVSLVYAAAAANHTVTFGMQSPAGYPVEQWGKRLQRAILNANNAIYKKRGVQGTFLLCGADAALELMDLNTFKLADDFRGGEDSAYGLERVGSISANFTVLRSQYLPSNQIIVGRKGSSILDAGAFWLPYVPLYVSERVFDPTYQGVRQSFMSRYGTHVASNEYFAKVILDPNSSGIVG